MRGQVDDAKSIQIGDSGFFSAGRGFLQFCFGLTSGFVPAGSVVSFGLQSSCPALVAHPAESMIFQGNFPENKDC